MLWNCFKLFIYWSRELIRIFKLDDHRDNMKTSILLDLYYYTIQFARDSKFSNEQTSAFFSILKCIHETCIGKAMLLTWMVFADELFLLLNVLYFSMSLLDISFYSTETPFGNVEHCFRYFRALVLCHAVKVFYALSLVVLIWLAIDIFYKRRGDVSYLSSTGVVIMVNLLDK